MPNPALAPHHAFAFFPNGSESGQEIHPPVVTADKQGNLGNIVGATHSSALTRPARETMVIYLKTQLLSRFQNRPLGFVNNTSWRPQNPPLLALATEFWNDHQFVPFVSSDNMSSEIDIVINNLDDGSHPMHLHGHSFYVLSSYRAEGRSGWGSYNPYEGEPLAPFNMVNPVKKDTVSVPRRGYVVMRVKTDNPGLWMMHCHMLVHMGTGMVTGLHVGRSNDKDHLDVDDSAANLCV